MRRQGRVGAIFRSSANPANAVSRSGEVPPAKQTLGRSIGTPSGTCLPPHARQEKQLSTVYRNELEDCIYLRA
eukprot:547599-Prorocentrum_minimum.AAC.1